MRIVMFGLMVGLVACVAKSKGTVASGSGTATSDDHLPWEAALSQGAHFDLVPDPALGSDGVPVTVTVTEVAADGGARVYTLDWGGESNGPTTLRVDHGVVTINDAAPEKMKDPFTPPTGATCYGEDFSNPEGCEDVCDADLCLSDAGIVGVDGLYAPDYSMYVAQ